MATKQQLTCFLSGLVGLKAYANQLNAKMLLCKPLVQSSEKLLRCANTQRKGCRQWLCCVGKPCGLGSKTPIVSRCKYGSFAPKLPYLESANA